MKKTWPFIWHFLFFAAIAVGPPFVVPYYQKLGLSGAQIGLLVGLCPLITLLCAPLGTGLADATGRHRLVMSLGLLAGSASLSALPLAGTFAHVALLVVLFTVSMSPVLGLATSATMFMLGDDREAYGRVRLGGTIGYGLVAMGGGMLVQRYGLRLAFWSWAAMLLATLAVSQKLVHARPAGRHALGGSVRALLGNRRWLLFLAVAFAGGLASVPTSSYFYPYMTTLGARESVMGIALSVGVIVEIPVLFYGDRLVGRLGSYGLLMLSLAVYGARLVAFAACGTVALALLVQLSNGLAYPAMSLAGALYAEEHAPAGMSATAQGLFSAMTSGGAAVGGFAAGLLLESMGAPRMFLAFGLAVLAAAAVAIAIGRRLGAGLAREVELR